MGDPVTQAAPAAASRIFGDRLPLAERFVEMLSAEGADRGVIGPREGPRLWERHVLNSAVVAELIPAGATVVDVGSGAGLPGVPIALARPDLMMTLLEPMARRVDWLTAVVAELELPVAVMRGRAEQRAVRHALGECDVAVARAVAPLGRLVEWCTPLVRRGGTVLAVKGATVSEEIDRDATAIARAGGGMPLVHRCGGGIVAEPTTVAAIEQIPTRRGRSARSRKER